MFAVSESASTGVCIAASLRPGERRSRPLSLRGSREYWEAAELETLGAEDRMEAPADCFFFYCLLQNRPAAQQIMTHTHHETISRVDGKRDGSIVFVFYLCVWMTQRAKGCQKQEEQNGRFWELGTKHVNHLLAAL